MNRADNPRPCRMEEYSGETDFEVFKPPCLRCSNRLVQSVQTVLFKVFKPLGSECSNRLV